MLGYFRRRTTKRLLSASKHLIFGEQNSKHCPFSKKYSRALTGEETTTASQQMPSWATRSPASGSPTPSRVKQGFIWRSVRRHRRAWRCQNPALGLLAARTCRSEAMALSRSTNKCWRFERTGKTIQLVLADTESTWYEEGGKNRGDCISTADWVTVFVGLYQEICIIASVCEK